jgi:hypothetical protein
VRTEAVPEGDDAADVTFTEQQGRILPDLSIGAILIVPAFKGQC